MKNDTCGILSLYPDSSYLPAKNQLSAEMMHSGMLAIFTFLFDFWFLMWRRIASLKREEIYQKADQFFLKKYVGHCDLSFYHGKPLFSRKYCKSCYLPSPDGIFKIYFGSHF
jgi:hypothetical protein